LVRRKSGKPKVAAPKKKAEARKSPGSRAPDLEVVKVRYHPAPDASLRLRRALTLILQAADAGPPEGPESEAAGCAEGVEESQEKKSGKRKRKDV